MYMYMYRVNRHACTCTLHSGMSAQGPQHVVVAVKFGFAFLLISFLPWVKVHVYMYILYIHCIYMTLCIYIYMHDIVYTCTIYN